METTTVKPIFLKQKDIPDSDKDRPTVLEICLAAERVAGPGTILGAQDIRGLWRIYPATSVARTDILVKGIRLRDTIIQVSNANPFILRDNTGEEKPSTKVWVDNIPLSVADTEIEHSLTKIGCELRSRVQYDRARDPDHKLTRFLTGRRFVFITVPPTPLDKLLKINIFTAKIFHKEQKLAKQPLTCSRCLEQNHHVSQCQKEIVCRECRQTGHKRGDPACKLAEKPTSGQPGQQQKQQQQDSAGVQLDIQGDQPAASSKKTAERTNSKTGERGDRSRPHVRQSTLFASFDPPLRSRSETPKRQRSKERHNPGGRAEKQSRRDDQRSDSPAETYTDCMTTTTTTTTTDCVTADDWR